MAIVNLKSNLAANVKKADENKTIFDHKEEDVNRVAKFLYSTAEGGMFLAKQVGLQFSNPRVESSNKNFLIGQPTRVYNLGVNTMAQVAVQGTGAHLDSHGLVPDNGAQSRYEYIVNQNNKSGENRLVKLYKSLIVPTATAGRTVTATNQTYSTNNNTIIDSYLGGPSSFLGIGRTEINRVYNTTKPARYTDESTFSVDYVFTTESGAKPISINYRNALGLSNEEFGPYGEQRFTQITGIDPNNPTKMPKHLSNTKPTIITRISVDKPEYRRKDNQIEVDGSDVLQYISATPGTTMHDNALEVLDQRINFDGVKPNVDGINLINIYTTKDRKGNENTYAEKERDLVKLKIEVINNQAPDQTEHLVFRSLIKTFSDTSESRFTEVKYIGRGDNFYIYDGYNGTYSLSFDIFAMSAAEMPVIYNKLNYLKSCMAPDYGKSNKMMANIFKLTVGNWLNSVPGFIRSLDITIPEDAPWDIDVPVYNIDQWTEQNAAKFTPATELPRYVTVTLSFVPIYNHLIKRGRNQPFISVDKLNYLK